VTTFKSVTELCTGGTICITLHLRVFRVLYKYDNLDTMHNITTIQAQTNPKIELRKPYPTSNITQKILNSLISLMMIN